MSLDTCPHGFDLSKVESCLECLKSRSTSETNEKNEIKPELNPPEGGGNPPNSETTETTATNTASTNNSTVETQTTYQAGDGATFNINQAISSNSAEEDEFRLTSLYDDSFPANVETLEEIDIEVRQYIDKLKSHRILIFGDSGDGYAYSAAKHIFSLFEIKDKENVRLLRIGGNKEESLGIESLSFERKDEDKDSIQEAFIIIDASKGAGSISFADSLLNPAAADIDHYTKILRENKFYLIFLLKNEDIRNWINKGAERRFPLKMFRKKAASHQPEEDIDFVRIKVDNIFDPEDRIDFLIRRTVCFVAAFFRDLTNGDFNELVNDWLKLESASLKTVSSDGTTKDIAAQYTSLDRIWRTKSHSYTESCFLIEKRDQGKRIIDFKSEQYREQIKEKLESYHWAFVEEKVAEIRKLFLIFNFSNNIADQSMSLYVDYIPGNEEKLLNWLLLVFDALNSAEKKQAKSKDCVDIPDSDNLSENEETAGGNYSYKRLEELFRKILHKPDLNNLISAFIERLLVKGCSQSAFKIVKRLRSASGFDDVRWLKQIYGRGDDTARKEIKKYFFKKIANSGFEDAVDKLNAWLPAEDAPAGKYSKFNEMALNLLVEYYAYLTGKYDEKLYGIEPTQFALFAFEDNKTAEIQIDKIIRYLLHPANLDFELDGISYEAFVAMLLEIWNKILRKFNSSKPDSEEKQKVRNKEIMNIILEKVILYSDKEFQEKIEFFWNKLSDRYRTISKKSTDWEESEKFTDDYELIENLRDDLADQQWKNQKINAI